MGREQLIISYNDLGMILSSFYFAGEEDFSSTEDLIDYLTSAENANLSVSISKGNYSQ